MSEPLELPEALARLAGRWRGAGVGDFPTIERFDYTERIAFELDTSYPLIHYEQRTWLANDEPSHWESGFLRWLEDGAVELSSAQDSGRVEVLRGTLVGRPDGFVLTLASIALANDPRLVRTRRTFHLDGGRLAYTMDMVTTTTDDRRIEQHLSATLERE